MTESALPSKIMPAFRRLRQHYDRKAENKLRDLIDVSHVYVEADTEYDNWNGGTHGHDIWVYVPVDMMGLIDLDEQDQIFKRLKEDLNKATPEVENEYVRAVYIKPIEGSDAQFQAATPFTREPKARPEEVGLWKDKALRLFLSHRDSHKAVARKLADALEPFGVSAFVAHDTIKPMKEWQKEILNGLITMEVMLVLLTDDFHESVWTNQEVGFALSKGIPIICVKVENIDPEGFISSQQALKVSYDNISSAAPQVYRILIEDIGQEGRLKEILIEAFVSSSSYVEAMESLTRLTETTDRLTDVEFDRIAKGYAQNDQLCGCAGIHNRGNWFKRYLEDATGKKLEFKDTEIIEQEPEDTEEIPF
jgi:hypothetical protein